jgi:hypothetical protein
MLTYEGKTAAPVYVGSYGVAAKIEDANYKGEATATLVIEGQTFSSWCEQNFGPPKSPTIEGREDADPDADGLSNLAEYALDTDPNALSKPPVVTLEPDGLAISFSRPKGLPGIAYIVESSEDLVNWSPLLLSVVHSDERREQVRAVDTLSTGDRTRRVIRLRLTH